jgi:hypothetical protein
MEVIPMSVTRLKRIGKKGVVPALCLLLAGCAGSQWGPAHAPKDWDYEGLLNGYASTNDLRDYDGTIVQADLISHRQPGGEVLNLDVWPIAGIGIGLLGVRAHIGPLGAGIGTLFHDPKPQTEWWDFEGETETFHVDG